MNRKDLYKSFEEVDDDILERSETTVQTPPVWLKWRAAAACLFLAAAIISLRFLPAYFTEKPAEHTPDTGDSLTDFLEESLPPSTGANELPPETSDGPTANSYGNTSDTYADLPELLAYLSSHDTHNDGKTEAAGGSSSSPSQAVPGQSELAQLVENTGVAVNITGEYAYHIGKSSVFISRLDGEATENAGSIEEDADALFICGSNLLVISQYQAGGDELNQEMSVRVSVYDISLPQEPVLSDEYIQLGDLTACWMSGADLYLITSDGVCACGWSRLEDLSKYYPALSHAGESVEWNNDDISILGAPASVHYSAITVINGNSREIVSKEALYGNIQSLFYGADWIAAVTAEESDTIPENPSVYTFDKELNFTGKINTAQIINAPETNTLENYTPQNGGYLNVVSLTKQKNIYRIFGTYTIQDETNVSSYFMAVSADTETGEAGSQLLSAENYPHSLLTEIIWEENRAIVCVGTMKNTAAADFGQETRFLFAEFNELGISFHENELTADYLSNRVGVGYGNPFGKFNTLIPMGNGIYVRYSNHAEGPGGFDIFDFTDSSAPVCLYSAEASLSGNDAFDYVWYIYNENTFGTLKVLLGAEDYLRNVKLSWCVYTIDAADKTKLTLQEEYFLDEAVKVYLGADSLGYTVFYTGGKLYYVTKERSSAAQLH